MPLSLAKVVELLGERALVPTRYLRLDRDCVFVECASLETGAVCFIYIPSRFSVPIAKDSKVLDVEYLELDDMPRPKREIGSPLPIPRSPLDALKEAVPLRSREEREAELLRGMVKQLERLQNLTKDTPYNLMTTQDGVMAYMRDGECDCYRIKDQAGRPVPRALRVAITLPALYESASTVGRDAGAIYDGIQERLSDHLGKCAGYLERVKARLTSTLPDRAVRTADADVRRRREMIEKYKSLLEELDSSHRVLVRKAEVAAESAAGETGVEQDLAIVRLSQQALTEVRECLNMKKRVVDEIRGLREEIDQIAFPLEQALFDTQDLLSKAERSLWQLSLT